MANTGLNRQLQAAFASHLFLGANLVNNDHSYPWVIALLNGEQSVNPVSVVRQALQTTTPSLLRSEWSVLIKIAAQNEAMAKLVQQHQALMQHSEDLQLILQDAKNHLPKNLDEVQSQTQQKDLQALQAQLLQAQQPLKDLTETIENLRCQLNDLAHYFRKNMTAEFEALGAVHQTYIQALLKDLPQLDEQTQNALSAALYAAVRHPEVEAELIANVKQQTAKDLTSKLKGWLNASKFKNLLQQKITTAFSDILPNEST